MSSTLSSKFLSATLALSIVAGSSFYVPSAQALTVYCSNCSTTWTQVLEQIEAVNTQINTAMQLQDALKQAMSLPDSIQRDVFSELNGIVQVYNNAKTLGRNIENLDNAFKNEFKGYDHYIEQVQRGHEVMPDRYKQWDEYGAESAKTALQAAGINVSSFDDESQALNRMLERSSSAAGRMQAMQAGNEIAAMNVQQLQKLRDLLATQITLQSNYIAQENEKNALYNASEESFRKNRPEPTKYGMGGGY